MASKKTVGDGRLFQNPVLEAMTKTHIAFPLTIFYGTGILALYVSLAKMHLPVAPSLALLDALHERWVRMLRSLPPEAFSRSLRHPDHGLMSVDQLLQLVIALRRLDHE